MTVSLFFQNFRHPVVDECMCILSMLGSRYAFMLLIPVAYWLVNRRKGWIYALVFLLSMQVNAFLKEMTQIPRPYQIDENVALIGDEPYTYAFPSGHAQGSTMIWGGLAAMTPSFITISGAVFITIAVGITRLYMGVHSMTDVAIGWIFGFLSLILMIFLFKLDEKNSKTLRYLPVRIFWSLSAIIIMLIYPAKDTVLTAVVISAIALLEPLEQHHIGIKDAISFRERFIRFMLGFGVAVIPMAFYMIYRPESLWILGVFFFMLGYWVVIGAPALFACFHRNGNGDA